MKSRHVLIAAGLLFLGTAMPAWAVEDCSLAGKDINLSNGESTKGITGVVRCTDRGTGTLSREIPYVKGKQDGIAKDYRWGTKKFVEYKDGQPTQRSQEWDEQGNLVKDTLSPAREGRPFRFYYPNGKLQHLKWLEHDKAVFWAVYNQDGQLTSLLCGDKSYFKEDRDLCGFGGKPSEVKLYSSQGTVLRSNSYLNGKLVDSTRFAYDGRTLETERPAGEGKVKTTFHPNGNVMIEAQYKGRFLDGVEKEYHASGKLIRVTQWSQGKMVAEEQFYLNGERKSRCERKKKGNTWLIGRQLFWDNGRLREEGVYQEKTDAVVWQGLTHARWKYESPIGEFRTYEEDGTPSTWELYDDAGLLKRRKVWDASGKLIRDEEFLEDGSRVHDKAKLTDEKM
jgi:antitoxin component YwqK of YwqJK toxin-antitoxin module